MTHPIRERLLEHLIERVREDESDYGDGHFAQEEHEQAQRVEFQETRIFAQSTETSTKGDNKDNAAAHDQHNGHIEENVIVSIEFD